MSPLVFVEGSAYDPNIPSQQAALFEMGFEYINGQWVQTGGNPVEYVAQPSVPYVPEYVATADKGSSLANTIFGTIQNPSPGVMQNVLSAGVWSGFDPNDIAGGLAVIKAYSLDVYGSVDLGTVRYSSEVLENEPSGVRPGTMERIVIPAWARRERGSPL